VRPTLARDGDSVGSREPPVGGPYPEPSTALSRARSQAFWLPTAAMDEKGLIGQARKAAAEARELRTKLRQEQDAWLSDLQKARATYDGVLRDRASRQRFERRDGSPAGHDLSIGSRTDRS
jgi:hypothetical protein